MKLRKVDTTEKPPVLIIDSNYICHYVFYKQGHLSYKGKSTGIIYGYLSQLLELLRLFKPLHIAFVWDSRKSARKVLYPNYKEKRGKVVGTTTMRMGEQEHEQMEQLRESILPMIGFKNVFMQIGYEADDVIASLCKNIENEAEHSAVIVSSDEDLYQLLSINTAIYKVRSNTLYTVEDFWNDWPGLAPASWAMVKAIGGCKTDEIEGIPGVGETFSYYYIVGNMKKIRGKDAMIDSEQGKEIIARNIPLVTLPFEGTKDYEMDYYEKRRLSGFIELCNLFGFKSFEAKLEEWKNLLRLK